MEGKKKKENERVCMEGPLGRPESVGAGQISRNSEVHLFEKKKEQASPY